MGLSVNDILIRMIKSIDLFKNINDEEALELSQNFKLQFYPVGSIILKEGTMPQNIYILKNGKLEAKKAKALKSIVLGEINPGNIFGEMSYLKDTFSIASIIVIQDADVWEIPIKKFDSFLKKYPNIMQSVYETMLIRDKINKQKMGEDDNLFKKNDTDDDDLHITL